MIPVAELAKLKEETVYETPDGGSYSPGLSGLPYTVIDETAHYQGFNRKEFPRMEGTIVNPEGSNNFINIQKLLNMQHAAEIAIPKELQAMLDNNALAQTIAIKDAEIATLRKHLALERRYHIIWEFAAKANIDMNLYEFIDDVEKGFKFVLKETKEDDSPPVT